MFKEFSMEAFGSLCALVAIAAAATAPSSAEAATGIIPANVRPEWGTFYDYNPRNQTRAQFDQNPQSGAHYRTVQVSTRPNSILSFDRIPYQWDSGEAGVIESFDLKVVTMKRVSDGATQAQQMWVMAGTKDAAGNLYPVVLESWPGAATVTFDLNENDVPDDGAAATFSITVPGGSGIPFAFHETYDRPYIVNEWYSQPAGSSRQFWAAHFRTPTCVENPYWVGGGIDACGVTNRRISIVYYEAWWSSRPDAPSDWGYGGGNLCVISGAQWPCPYQGNGALQYYAGSLESLALGTAAIWWTHVWSGSQGAYSTFSLFFE